MSFSGYKIPQMAGKLKPMSQVKQLLLMHQQGNSIKYTARSLGISKNTVKSYLQRLQGLDQPIRELLTLSEPALESLFSCGSPAYKDERYVYMRDRLDYYSKELNRKGVTMKLLWEEYISEVRDGYGLTQFRFHLRQQLIARKPSMVLQHEPAHKLYIDFAGHKLAYIDTLTGERIECPVFVACLPYSDYGFAFVVRSQTIEDFIYALRCCLEHLGGAPVILVPDNFKAAVIKANNYEPTLNNHVYLSIDRHYYSVPYKWIGQRVKVIYTRTLVRIYVREEQVALHVRSYEAGKYTTILDHLCSHHQHYLSRSPAYCMKRAEQVSAELHRIIQALFDQGRPAEQNYRTCDGFFSLDCQSRWYHHETS